MFDPPLHRGNGGGLAVTGYTLEELMTIVSTAMLLPAMVTLVVLALKHHFTFHDPEQWSPTRFPERDWWGSEDAS